MSESKHLSPHRKITQGRTAAARRPKHVSPTASASSSFIDIGPAFPRSGLTWLENFFDWKNEARGLGVLENFLLKPLRATVDRISHRGLHFIYVRESAPGISDHLYWPLGASGVTLGPGYDLKNRAADSIITDLKQIGIDETISRKVALV